MNKSLLKTQVVMTYTTIISALAIVLFGLGFMTDFYTLFMDGNDDMYNLFKDLQGLNTQAFSTGLIFFVMALFLVPFDLNKKAAGIFGVLLTLMITITNIVNGSGILTTGSNFKAVYNGIDFSSLENYNPSALPFEILSILWIIGIISSVILFIITTINFFTAKKEGV